MPNELKTFLTRAQVVDAVAADFGQYGPQPELFRRIAPLVLGTDFKTGAAGGEEQAWVRRGGGYTPVGDTALGFYLIHILETADPDEKMLAWIAELVFEVAAGPGTDGGRTGVWIENQMKGFACKGCGNCCTQLDTVCTAKDVEAWKTLGRHDILEWVREEAGPGGKRAYRIWVDPRTGERADSCPFLGTWPGSASFFCTIQEVKPRVCREYPFTKKHAGQTGCPGFFK
ncbi:MAG: YkgJ family cysteine cluster protein [Desulfobacter sp.]|nr:MAG: YkgJ family cysteine cluster protein [Desulfobacter sp.]